MLDTRKRTIHEQTERRANLYLTSDPAVDVSSWGTLARESHRHVQLVRHWLPTLKIVPVDSSEPYDSAKEMFDSLDNGRFAVSDTNHPGPDHPFDRLDNLAFRLAHDILGHYRSGSDFSSRGEYWASLCQAVSLVPEALPALYSEVVLQSAVVSAYGSFPEQKAVKVDSSDPDYRQWRWDVQKVLSCFRVPYGTNPIKRGIG